MAKSKRDAKKAPAKTAGKPSPAAAQALNKPPQPDNRKTDQLQAFVDSPNDTFLTSNQGVRVNDDQNTLKAGLRGPSLLEDQLMREKIMHFDHERIPERVVHARGSGAHGTFVANGAGSKYCVADFLNADVETPVFVRFSTVAGSRGSTDLARDVRGFATKFYTEEGIFDLVGNNMPVFFIQDAIKFPDLIHAVKPEPHNEIPQAQSAHDTFWDFISLAPESMHMIMWLMSDRAIPRSYRMMEGFGVHTFRFIDEKGQSRFVKFHWKPVLGVHSVLWDEAVKISGKDPDFHRRDLWDAIENGQYPEFELGVQVIESEDEIVHGIDLLDPTKLIPEELVPVEIVGKMTLNRNPDNFFAETEQVAYCISHIVPGIDFTNDPLLQGRLFSYPDTQLKRLGGPNFHEIPINKSLAPVRNNQRDGHMRQTINPGRVSYGPNTIGGGAPFQAMSLEGGFVSHAQELNGPKIRGRSESFFDHFSQATLFYNSQTTIEKQHIVEALRFELLKCESPVIREGIVALLERVDLSLAEGVAEGLGITIPAEPNDPQNQIVPADADAEEYRSLEGIEQEVPSSDALSILKNVVPLIATKKVAVLIGDGFDAKSTESILQALIKAGAAPKIVGPHGGVLIGSDDSEMQVDFQIKTVGSVLFDAVVMGGGVKSFEKLAVEACATLFINESYKHLKPIGALGEGKAFVSDCLSQTKLTKEPIEKLLSSDNGIACSDDTKDASQVAKSFLELLANGRQWTRLGADLIPV